MFIGHFAVALASKRLAPRTSLATLIAAAQTLDILWPLFLLLGLEHYRIAPGITKVRPLDFYDVPFTHSLSMAVVWSLVFALIYFRISRYAAGAWIVGGLVLSHWFLDWIVHRPDLPLLWHGGPKVGLGLWNSWPATISVEAVLLAAGVWVYLRSTRARDLRGTCGFWALVGLLVLISLADFAGRPPAGILQLALGALILWSTVLALAWWTDRHRAFFAAS